MIFSIDFSDKFTFFCKKYLEKLISRIASERQNNLIKRRSAINFSCHRRHSFAGLIISGAY